jgi:hypothetical protein
MEALMIIGAIIGLGVFVIAGISLHKHAESTYGAGVFRLRPLAASALCVILGLISLGLTDTDGSFTLNGIQDEPYDGATFNVLPDHNERFRPRHNRFGDWRSQGKIGKIRALPKGGLAAERC